MSRRRHWYHVTDRRADAEWEAERRPPHCRGREEPETPRLCVSDAVARALAAVWHVGPGPVAVYVSEQRRTVPPSGVWDTWATGERWIIPPVRLYRVAVIPRAAIEAAQDGNAPSMVDGMSALKRARILQNMAAVVAEHAPSCREAWVERYAAKVVEMLEQREMCDATTNHRG